jgi:hypothetical protein
VNGGAKQTYHMKQKLGTGGGVSTVFISYDIPLSYSSPNASIEFAAFIPSFCPSNPDWEFKGVMQVRQDPTVTPAAFHQSNSPHDSKHYQHAEQVALSSSKQSRSNRPASGERNQEAARVVTVSSPSETGGTN